MLPMGDFLSYEKVGIFLYYVVPGFLIVYARAQLVNNRKLPLADAIINYVVLSLLYQAIILPISLKLKPAEMWTGAHALAWIAVLFIAPAALGFAIGLNARAGWTRRILGKLKVPTTHPTDSAWDWRFAGCEQCWVLVVLKDGTRWAGHLGAESFMSTDRAERDLYVQSVYSIDDENIWTVKGSSVWIAHGEVQSIEFWPLQKEILE